MYIMKLKIIVHSKSKILTIPKNISINSFNYSSILFVSFPICGTCQIQHQKINISIAIINKNYKTFSKSSQYLPSQEILKVLLFCWWILKTYEICVESSRCINFKEKWTNKLKIKLKHHLVKLRMLVHRLYVIFDPLRVFQNLTYSITDKVQKIS